MASPSRPVQGRLPMIDAVRGVAILGTLATNVWVFARLGDPGVVGSRATGWWGQSGNLPLFFGIFADGKFLALLSILLGAGLSMQFQRARSRALSWPGQYGWRMAVLFVEGVLHYALVFEGDVLMAYGIAGLLVATILPWRRDRLRKAVWIAVLCHALAVASFVGLVGLAKALRWSGADAGAGGLLAAATAAYGSGSYATQVAFRISHFGALRVEAIALVPYVTLLLLLGVQLHRLGALSPDIGGRRFRRELARWGLGLGVPLSCVAALPWDLGQPLSRYVFAPVLALGYLGAIGWLCDRGRLRSATSALADVGRIPLSCYLLQNVLAAAFFCGIGATVARELGAVGIATVFTVVTVIQIRFARSWLRRFDVGPFEWLWRVIAAKAARVTA